MTGGGLARQFGRAGASFYDGTGDRTLTTCPDCLRPADGLFGDHDGSCLDSVVRATPTSALGIIRKAALDRPSFSVNDLREQFMAAGVRKTSRGPAMVAAQKRQWIEVQGMVPSNDPKTKKHKVQLYRSLIFTTRRPTPAEVSR